MASEEFKMSRSIFVVYLLSCLIGLSICVETNRLEILPVAAIQYRPIGKSLILTCRPLVSDLNLVSDLQWRDNENMTILPKPSRYYYPMYDSKGHVIPSPTGQTEPPMYTETLPADQSLALIIPSLKESMAGKYFCSASYAGTQLMENGVTVTTYIAITWKDAPENQYPILGSDYIVRCEVTAIPSPTIDWLRNGDQIKTGDRHRILDNGLEIRNVQESDDGTYTCRAAVVQTGELGERNIRVEVYTKPQIVHLKPTLEAVEGQSFSTYCNATGKPVPEIIWIKDKTQQNVETADRFLVNPQTGTLTITKVEQDDYGTYTCRAKNQAGEVDQKTKLDVLVLPKIFEFYNRTGAVQKEIALTCRAHGRPAPEITFKRWGSDQEFVARNQPDDDRIYLEQLADNEKGESSGILRISKAMRSDDGLYQCVARNKGHTAYKVGHITVEYPPDFTYMKTLPPVFSWEERVANLSCLAEGIPNATIEWRWNGRNIKELMDPNLSIEGTGPRSNLIIKPIDKRFYSVYKCIATNIHGKAEHDMQLKEGRVPGPIDQAKIKVLTATSITFDIIGPATERGLPISAYRVQYREEYNRDWSTALSREWSPDSDYTVEGLRPQTKYLFRFAARNHVGIGPWSNNIPQTTPRRSAPEEPKTLHSPVQEDEDAPVVVSPYSDHFELRWSVPADNGEPIDYYQVRYCPGHKINGEWSELGNDCITNEVVESTSYEMSHLSANTYYRIELKAHNAIGFSTPSSIMMKTARDNPYISGSTLTCQWSGCILVLLLATVTILGSTKAFEFDIGSSTRITSATSSSPTTTSTIITENNSTPILLSTRHNCDLLNCIECECNKTIRCHNIRNLVRRNSSRNCRYNQFSNFNIINNNNNNNHFHHLKQQQQLQQIQ